MGSSYFDHALLERLRAYYASAADRVEQEYRFRQYHLITSSIERCMPSFFEGKSKKAFFLEYLVQRRLPPHDAVEPKRVYDVVFEEEDRFLDNLDDNTFVLTYHFGSYRMIVTYLASRGYDFNVLVNHRIKSDYEAVFKDVAKLSDEFGVKSRIGFIDAESMGSASKLYKSLRKGITVAYLDGNTGAGGQYVHDNSARIDFFGTALSVRTGLLDMLNYLPCEVLVCMNGYDELYNIVFRKLDVAIDAQSLYRALEGYVKRHPEQWEGWMYVYKHWVNEAADEPGRRHVIANFDSRKHGLFRIGKDSYVMDKNSRYTYALSESEFKYLKEIDNPY